MLKADERLLFGSLADHQPKIHKPVSSVDSSRKAFEEQERAKRVSLVLFKETNTLKKRSTGNRVSLGPNTSRLSQISYHVAPKTQMTQPKLVEPSLE